MAEKLFDVPMTIYMCKLSKSNRCLYKGVKPSGASEGYGTRFCNVPASPVKSIATDCDRVEVVETEIVAKVTKSGVIT